MTTIPPTHQLPPLIVPQPLSQNVNVRDRRIRIAISGCTSSGKTSLCYLLVAVFSGTSVKLKHLDAGNDNVADQEIWNPITKTVLLHQDNHFKPKQDCPVASWKEIHPHMSDHRTIESRNGGTARHYTTGIRTAMASDNDLENSCREGVGVGCVVMCNNVLEFPRENTNPKLASVSKKSPHADCRDAIDLQSLWRKFHSLSNSKDGRKCVLDESAQESNNVEECLKLVGHSFVLKLQKCVSHWVKREAERNARIGFKGVYIVNGELKDILILEGFLLFTLEGGVGEWVQCMEDMDVNLFLPTSKSTSFRRRFQRPEYIDAPIGMRESHHKWRTEAYFHHVAWPEYEREHGWLFKSGNVNDAELETSIKGREKRINMRPERDAGFEFTLEWAIDTILMRLREGEMAGREAFLGRKGCVEDLLPDRCFRDDRFLGLDISEEEAGIHHPRE